MEALAMELRDRHLALTESLSQGPAIREPSQIPSQALELAMKELEDRLPSASTQDENISLSLDQAMAFLAGHTPPS